MVIFELTIGTLLTVSQTIPKNTSWVNWGINVNNANVLFYHLAQKLTHGKLCFHFKGKGGDTNGLCLPPVWLVLVRHGVARLQQQDFMQLQRESFNICDSEEHLQASPLLLRQLLLEL